ASPLEKVGRYGIRRIHFPDPHRPGAWMEAIAQIADRPDSAIGEVNLPHPVRGLARPLHRTSHGDDVPMPEIEQDRAGGRTGDVRGRRCQPLAQLEDILIPGTLGINLIDREVPIALMILHRDTTAAADDEMRISAR